VICDGSIIEKCKDFGAEYCIMQQTDIFFASIPIL
jgi:hypothetical protein